MAAVRDPVLPNNALATKRKGERCFLLVVSNRNPQRLLCPTALHITPATGARADQGIADFIRAPVVPPDPVTPVAGTYIGAYVSHLGRSRGTLRMELMQEGTSLTGQLFLDEGTARALSWEVVGGVVSCVIEGEMQPCTTVGGILPCVIVGGIAPCVEVVLIGAGASGRLVAGGAVVPPPDDGSPPPDDSLTAVVSLELLGGGVDVATMAARRQRAGR